MDRTSNDRWYEIFCAAFQKKIKRQTERIREEITYGYA